MNTYLSRVRYRCIPSLLQTASAFLRSDTTIHPSSSYRGFVRGDLVGLYSGCEPGALSQRGSGLLTTAVNILSNSMGSRRSGLSSF